MTTWYIKEVYTPDDTDLDRRRTHTKFEAQENTRTQELAILGMIAIGWAKEVAEQAVKDESLDVEEGVLCFEILGSNGEYEFTIQTDPIP